MAETTRTALFTSAEAHPRLERPMPSDVLLYEIRGPLFFGAAQRAMDMLVSQRAPIAGIRCVILDMESIPFMDVTGCVALETAIQEVTRRGSFAIRVGVAPQPLHVIERTHLLEPGGGVRLASNLTEAIALAEIMIAEQPEGPALALTASGAWRPSHLFR